MKNKNYRSISMKESIIDNITFRFGKNAEDNTQLIKDSEENWTWFHLEKFPSCHVVVCQNDIDDSIITMAAELVKENSKYKFKNIGVIYCKINNLLHGDKPGLVHFVSMSKVNKVNI